MAMGTAGAVFDAIARMRQAQRDLARPRPGHVRPPRSRSGGAPDRHPFPCFFLCSACGWLEEGTTGDPMRRITDDAVAPGACPACHATAWVDLRRQSTALAYREAESLDHRGPDHAHRGLWIGAVTSATVTCGLLLAGPGLVMAAEAVTTLFVATWLVTWLAVRALGRWARPGRARPRRWRHPLARPLARRRRAVRGAVQGDACLRAPLSQAPCLGWALQVWSRDELLLDEQHHAELVVDGEAFAPDSVVLALASQELRPEVDDHAFVRFLQRRGLSLHDPALRVREACLVAGTTVTLGSDDPARADLVLRACA